MTADVMKGSEVLSRAADLIEPEGAWTTLHAARDRLGFSAAPNSAKAVCWCAVGALYRAEHGRFVGPNPADWLYPLIDGASVSEWNDAPGRTQAEVVSALRKASQLAAEAGE